MVLVKNLIWVNFQPNGKTKTISFMEHVHQNAQSKSQFDGIHKKAIIKV